MAIKNIIARGIGFTPGSISFIPTHGFTPGAVVLPAFAVMCGELSIYPAVGASLSVSPAAAGGLSLLACEDT